MNRKLDLRTGKPVWMAYRAPRVETKRLVRDIKTDVLVVGMGISGAMIAEALTADGLDVVVIDRRGAIVGSTPATTALRHGVYLHPWHNMFLSLAHGEAEIDLALEATDKALAAVAQRRG